MLHGRLNPFVRSCIADIVDRRQGVKSLRKNQSKADRVNAAKQLREKKRAETVQAKRMAAFMPPRIVALLPLSAETNVRHFWKTFIDACVNYNVQGEEGDGASMEMEMGEAMAPITVFAGPQKKVKVTILPPPADMNDPLGLTELGKYADFVVCLLPGNPNAVPIDGCGAQALDILRSMGMPSTLAITQTHDIVGGNVLKERSAAKKRAAEALERFIPSDHYKLMAADNEVDVKQIVRHVTDSSCTTPIWRQQRPHVIPDAAEFYTSTNNDMNQKAEGTLVLTGYIREKALTANQLIHIPGAGDFQIEKIESVAEPQSLLQTQKSHHQKKNVEATMAMNGETVIAVSLPEERESLVREHDVDPLDAEQTWPTEQELAEAEAEAKARKRRLPKGTSDYQAAWIIDDNFSDASEDDDDDDDSMTHMMPEEQEDDEGWMGMDTGTELDPEEFSKLDLGDREAARAREEDTARRAREADDVLYPDEFELTHDVPARRRLAKYRGLKSFRTSPWDPKEDLPLDYARVFAFENFKRAQKRALALSNKVNRQGGDAGADVGTYARVYVCNVPQDAAMTIVERVNASQQGLAPLLSTWGLLQHEVKLSVLNFSVKKHAGVDATIANKEELIFVTGIRTYTARPILSTDEHGADKHKMERFLHEGRVAMATIYGPITYPPCPLLAFKRNPFNSSLQLVATGSLKSCNPDRVVVKKIVLTGFPIKCHRSKAIVRSMFYTPEDIRWFSPVELWTKHGRRGRIREPLGTHGLFKSIFDGPLSQQDTVCMSLYKRVYPKWPESTTFASI